MALNRTPTHAPGAPGKEGARKSPLDTAREVSSCAGFRTPAITRPATSSTAASGGVRRQPWEGILLLPFLPRPAQLITKRLTSILLSIPRPQFHQERRAAPRPASPAAQPRFEIDQPRVTRPAPRQRRRGEFSLMPAYPAAHPDDMPGAQILESQSIPGRQAVIHVRGLFLYRPEALDVKSPRPALRWSGARGDSSRAGSYPSRHQLGETQPTISMEN
jgi:hypothetical protein